MEGERAVTKTRRVLPKLRVMKEKKPPKDLHSAKAAVTSDTSIVNTLKLATHFTSMLSRKD